MKTLYHMREMKRMRRTEFWHEWGPVIVIWIAVAVLAFGIDERADQICVDGDTCAMCTPISE